MADRKYPREVLWKIASLYCTVAMNNGNLPFERSARQVLLLTNRLKKWGRGTVTDIIKLTLPNSHRSRKQGAGDPLLSLGVLLRITNPNHIAEIVADLLDIARIGGGIVPRNKRLVRRVAHVWDISLNMDLFTDRLPGGAYAKEARR